MSKTLRSTLALSLLALLAVSSESAHAQILFNGSFEYPTQMPTPTGSSVAGAGTDWTSTGTVTVDTNNYQSEGYTPYGAQFLHLTSGSSASQVITGFVAGQSYVLGADFADLSGGTTPKFTFSIAGAANDSGTFTPLVEGGTPNPGYITFQSGVLEFMATTSGSATITLLDSGSTDLALDNLALYSDASFAPEPSAASELLFGLGALGLAGWAIRRRVLSA